MIRRVLMTADTLGGVWTYSIELSRFLSEQGVQVGLATMGRLLSEDQRAEIRSIPSIHLLESDFKLEWMEDPWTDVDSAGRWLLNLETSFRPDLIHLNSFCFGNLPWSAPHLVVFHSCVCSWWESVRHQRAPEHWNPYKIRVSAGLAGADLVIAPTKAMLEEAAVLYGPFARSRVIPNGRSTQPFATRRIKEPFVLSVGRIWDEAKNLTTLANAAQFISWPVVVAGESRDQIPIKNVELLGHVSPQSVAALMARAGIYALPARYEPFGLSVLESALSGCALVLGDIPSLRENWHGCALFVDPDDPQRLAAAVQSLIDDPELMSIFGSSARDRARRFGLKRFGDSYLAAYNELCRTSNGSRASSGPHNTTLR